MYWELSSCKLQKLTHKMALKVKNGEKNHWESYPIKPQFVGYNNRRPGWPIKEEYAMYTLAIFKPWRDKIETLKHTPSNTYAQTLLDFLWDPNMPEFLRSDILLAKRNEKCEVDHRVALLGGATATPMDENDRVNEDA